jgi:hypothetical protein
LPSRFRCKVYLHHFLFSPSFTAHLTGGGDEDLGLGPLGEPEHVDSADGVGLDGLDRVVHVVGRGGGGRQVVDLVHLDEQGVH